MFLIVYSYCHEENNHGKAGAKFETYAKTPAEGLKKIKAKMTTLTKTDKLSLVKGSDPKIQKYRVHVNGEPTGWQVAKVPPMFKIVGDEDRDHYNGDPQTLKDYCEGLMLREAEMAGSPVPKLKWKKGELYDSDYPTGLSIKKVW